MGAIIIFLFLLIIAAGGEKSTYKIVVGRSKKINGPFVDRDGVSMNLGGGSTLLEGDKNWYGGGP
jgi:arabinan endo-1,5-alpha-L-arabinosidase